MRSGDATTDLDQNQLKNRIIDHVGVQADMLLPDGIAVDDPKTYGEGVLWQDTSRPQSNRHVTGRARIFLLGAAGEQEENGLGASASGPARRCSGASCWLMCYLTMLHCSEFVIPSG